MEDASLIIIGISIFLAALIGARSGVATAFIEMLAGFIIVHFIDVTSSSFIHEMSELGLITLMFLSGLEVDFRFFKEKAKESLVVGLTAYIIPFLFIGGVVTWLFELSFLQAFLFALALSGAFVGVLYPILRKKGPLGPRRRMILSAAMVMEFLSMALLGVVYSDLSWPIVVILAFLIVVGFALPRLQKRFHIFRVTTQEGVGIKLILALLLVAKFLTSASAIDVVLVVFVLGMLLADFVRKHEQLKTEIEAISFGFLTPIFFFTVGGSLTIFELGQHWWEIAVLIVISFVATFVATYTIAKKHFPNRARTMAMLFNAPLGVGIVVASVGLEKGVINHEQHIILIGAVVISSFIAAVFGNYPAQQEESSNPQIT